MHISWVCCVTYDLASEDVLIDFNCLAVDNVQIRVEALSQALSQFFLHWNWLIGVLINCALKFLQAITQIGPFSGTLKSSQDSR